MLISFESPPGNNEKTRAKPVICKQCSDDECQYQKKCLKKRMKSTFSDVKKFLDHFHSMASRMITEKVQRSPLGRRLCLYYKN